MADFAVPTLPMRDPTETRVFYEKLGFICAHEAPPPDTFLFMMRNGVQIQFFEVPGIDGSIRDSTCCIYVDDLDATYAAFKAANVGKLMPIEHKPWGVPEFVLIDIGYEDTVIPEINLAIIAQHDMLFLGEKGQGKSRLMRSLVRFLDDEIPRSAPRPVPTIRGRRKHRHSSAATRRGIPISRAGVVYDCARYEIVCAIFTKPTLR